jgi:hypothetical protein
MGYYLKNKNYPLQPLFRAEFQNGKIFPKSSLGNAYKGNFLNKIVGV